MPPLNQAHLQSIYRPIIIAFCSLALLILGVAAYSGSARAVITLSAVPQDVKTTVTITVGPKTDGSPLYLTGAVKVETLEETVTTKPNGTGTLVPAHARGHVTFHNETTKAQPLASGTRLRSPDDIIVRTTARVDVPAGGRVEADVIADPLGVSGNLPPGHFVIVALWPGLQDKIYATSTTAFTGGLANQASGLSLEELTAASNEAEAALREKFGTSTSGTLKQLLPVDVVTVPPASEPSSEYTVTVSMKGLTVTYNADQLEALLREHLAPVIPADQTLVALLEPSLVIESQPTTDEVVITVKGTGKAQLTSASRMLQPKIFTNLHRQEILSRLNSNETVKNVTVKFSPPWRQTAPAQSGKIQVVVRSSE